MLEPTLDRQAGERLVDVSRREVDDVQVVSVAGEIDRLSTPALQDAIDDAVRRPAGRAIVIDLSAVTFLGSAGLATLATAAARPGHEDRPLRVVATSHAVLRPIQVTGLDDVLALYATLDEALSPQ
jgi:anti-sigma B factor antagonist